MRSRGLSPSLSFPLLAEPVQDAKVSECTPDNLGIYQQWCAAHRAELYESAAPHSKKSPDEKTMLPIKLIVNVFNCNKILAKIADLGKRAVGLHRKQGIVKHRILVLQLRKMNTWAILFLQMAV